MRRLERLDGVRGILAVYVMLGHALPLTAMPPWLGALFAHGQAAVDLFFALSGLVIAGSLEHYNWRLRPFITARAWRLLPVYFLVLGFSCMAEAQGNPLPALPWAGAAARAIVSPGLPHPLWAHLLAHVTLLHGAIPNSWLPYGWVTLLGPAWSLSTEWQFYLLIGLIAPRRFFLFALALLGLGAAYHLLPQGGEFSRAFLPAAAPWFALGLASRLWLTTNRLAPFIICFAGICLLSAFTGAEKLLTALAWVAIMLAQQRGWGQPLAARPLLYLGGISYPLYLVNEPAERIAALWLGPLLAPHPAQFSLAFLAVSLGLSLGGAALLHHGVEKPLMQRNKKFTSIIIAPPVRQ
ncbi:MAG: acyltransferase [Rhodospirillales bacterium]|nr:acyltransferase [Rhodospirillales bacterium]MDE2458325.1 acyltransferase [Rhodospirillales bacterium]